MQALRSPFVRRFLLVLLVICAVLLPLLARWTNASQVSQVVAMPEPSSRGAIHDTVQKANGSGIRVRYRAEGVAAIGQPFPVTLYFDAVSDPAATLRLSADAALQMSMPASEVSLPVGASELALTVTASVDGLAYLNVFTMQLGVGGVTSIPVQVGAVEPKLPSRGDAKLDANGQPVIAFKVR